MTNCFVFFPLVLNISSFEGNESFEKLSSMSLISNITVYLSTQYNVNGTFVVNVVNIWIGTSNIATLAGAFIADTRLGRYRTLLYGSIASFLVLLLLYPC